MIYEIFFCCWKFCLLNLEIFLRYVAMEEMKLKLLWSLIFIFEIFFLLLNLFFHFMLTLFHVKKTWNILFKLFKNWTFKFIRWENNLKWYSSMENEPNGQLAEWTAGWTGNWTNSNYSQQHLSYCFSNIIVTFFPKACSFASILQIFTTLSLV